MGLILQTFASCSSPAVYFKLSHQNYQNYENDVTILQYYKLGKNEV